VIGGLPYPEHDVNKQESRKIARKIAETSGKIRKRQKRTSNCLADVMYTSVRRFRRFAGPNPRFRGSPQSDTAAAAAAAPADHIYKGLVDRAYAELFDYLNAD